MIKKTIVNLIKNKETWLIALLLVLAFCLRLFRLNQLLTFTFDQGRDFYALQSISRGDLKLVGPTTGLGGVFLGPFYHYFLLPGFILAAGSPIGVVYWLSFWVTLSLVLVYLIMKPLAGKKWALFTLLIFIFTFGSIDEARVIWNPSLGAPLMLLSFYLLFQSKKKSWLLIPSIFAYGLSLQTELAYTFFLFPAYLWWMLRRYSWKTVLLAGAVFALTLLPQAAFELRHQFIMTKSIMSQGPETKISLKQVWETRPSQMADIIEWRTFGRPTPANILFIITLLSLAYLGLKKNKTDEEFFLVLAFCLPLIGMMFHTGNYGNFFDYYLNPHYLSTILVLILSWRKLKFGKVLAGSLLLVMLVSFYKTAQIIYSPELLQYRISRQIEALQYARQIQTNPDSALEIYVPNLVPINYQYLSEWLAQSHQAAPMDFGVKDHAEYILLYEDYPAAVDVTFEPWLETWKNHAQCTNQKKFGIIVVEKCLNVAVPASL